MKRLQTYISKEKTKINMLLHAQILTYVLYCANFLLASSILSVIKLTNKNVGQEDGAIIWPVGETIRGPAALNE